MAPLAMRRVWRDNDADLDADWCALKEQASARERVIASHLPFARMLAAKLYARRTYPELEFHDYFQHASIGLIEAVDHFDVTRGVKFELYAAPRIQGAILNGIATLSEKQEQVSARKRVMSQRVASLHDGGPVAGDAGALFAHLAALAVGLALGLVLEGTGMVETDQAAYPDNCYQRTELRQLRAQLGALIDQLGVNERRVITYHYLQQLPFGDIAAMLGLSNGRVSQIHKAALAHLRDAAKARLQVDLRY